MPGVNDDPAPGRPAETGTVVRVLQLLSCFAETEEWPLQRLAQRLDLPRSTTHRLLNLCRGAGFVAAEGGGTYRPGTELYRLAGRLAAGMPLRRLARPVLDGLTAACGEVSMLTALDRDRLMMFYAAKAEPDAPLRYVIELDLLQPLSWGASARSLLAHLTPAEIEEVVRRADPSPLDGRPLDVQELLASLESIRRDGYGVTHNQRTPGGVGVSAPFFDGAGEVRGNISLTIPAFRYREEDRARYAGLVLGAAAQISRLLGRP
ncbi:IclR family transcriptional regulator [Roseomonas populi]|uniref:IclR family transcriptional regulator n=1 Tax=Roseomonas populi TaxID=3121582 RepID=A0ABT1XDG6_9PROT|nr:IclR family transcriptional regulator [Roseomonas pecuniae]MCR0985172.1 IclR family transcriptional regulator [Roseomonas pecuniae]